MLSIRRNFRKFRLGIEWNSIFSGKDFQKFSTTFSAVPEKWKPTENKPVPFETEISENSNRKFLVNGKRPLYLTLFEESCRRIAPGVSKTRGRGRGRGRGHFSFFFFFQHHRLFVGQIRIKVNIKTLIL